MYIGAWNIRGLMDLVRQAEVRRLVSTHDPCLVGLIETKVHEISFESMSFLLSAWNWVQIMIPPIVAEFGWAGTLSMLVMKHCRSMIKLYTVD